MLNFKSFRSAGSVLAGIELMHMIRKGQVAIDEGAHMSFADQFYALAGQVRPTQAGVMLGMKNPGWAQQRDRTTKSI